MPDTSPTTSSSTPTDTSTTKIATTNEQLVIGIDADDTLWDNESDFAETEALFRELMATWTDGPTADERLVAIERANLVHYGYGVKAFVLSMIEGAIEISGGAVSTETIGQIIDRGKQLLTHEVDLLPDVRATVEALAAHHRVLIITKGDLHHQAARLEGSGLLELVEAHEIVAEKDPDTYRSVLQRYDIDPAHFVMIGNSVKSDVLPVLEIGGRAIHIPFHVTWALEQVEVAEEPTWIEATAMGEVPALIAALEAKLP